MEKSAVKSPKIIVLCGPTASGKSSLAVEIARAVGGEIISADSRQVYRGLDIGTAKISPEEMQGVPHHLLDVADPSERMSVADFKKRGSVAILDILSRGKVPVICGGTGYYIDALVFDITAAPVEANEMLRAELETKSTEELFEILKQKDLRRASQIDAKNKRRLVRALEIIDAIGAVPEQEKHSRFDTLWIGLTVPPEEHKKIISKRIESRIQKGMIDEAKNLHAAGLSYKRMRELGLEYRFLADLLEGVLDEKGFTQKLGTATWQYVRRQYTWFRKNPEIKWFAPEEKVGIIPFIQIHFQIAEKNG